ncbi:hypothetical protein D3C83_89970 [compost metagenome]
MLCPGVWPGERSIITVPSPNTSLSPVCGSTLRFSAIHWLKPFTFAPPIGGLAFTPSQSPLPISSVAFLNGASWPVWSAWKWLMPTYFT